MGCDVSVDSGGESLRVGATGDAGACDLREVVNAVTSFVKAVHQHPGQAFLARELHELLGMPAADPAVNVTRSRLAPSPVKASSPNPDVASARDGLSAR